MSFISHASHSHSSVFSINERFPTRYPMLSHLFMVFHVQEAHRIYNDFDNRSAQGLLIQLYADLDYAPADKTLISVICALENAIFLNNLSQSIPDFPEIVSHVFVNRIIKEQKLFFRQEYEREAVAIDRANRIDEILSDIEVCNIYRVKSDISIANSLLSYLKAQKEIYLKEPSAQYRVIIEKQATELRKDPLPINKPMQIKTKLAIAYNHLAFLNGINPRNNQRYMFEQDYHLLVSYVEYLIQNESIPVVTRKIPKCNIAKTWLKYTLYLIHKELYGSIQDVWISFMQAVFYEFSPQIVEFSTLKTKFSVFPSGYHQAVNRSGKW